MITVLKAFDSSDTKIFLPTSFTADRKIQYGYRFGELTNQTAFSRKQEHVLIIIFFILFIKNRKTIKKRLYT